MPRTLVRAHRDEDRDKSLGWLALAWMEYFVVHGPGAVQGEPVHHGDEYTGVIVDAYMCGVHPSNNHMIYDSTFLSRPKGCDKSGLGARLALFEALGPCRFAGWAKGGEVYRDPWGLGFTYVYSPGEPMGKPVKSPTIRILATEVDQASSNVFATIHYNLTGDEEDENLPLLAYVPNIDVGVGKVLLPGRGQILVSTSASASKDGGKETFCVLDETHLYTTPDLRRMYRTITRNIRKRKKDGTWFLETTTMFAPGENSMAEATYAEAEALREGRKKRGRHRLLYDHRWGECADVADEPELRKALIEAYGDAMAWMDLDGLVDEFYDLRNEEADSRRYFLNAKTSSADAWIKEHEWMACKRPDKSLRDKDIVTLGLDGAVRRDATALVACRLSDGHIELLALWERPERKNRQDEVDRKGRSEDNDWEVDVDEVDAAVAKAMKRFQVVAFFADPPYWREHVNKWDREYGAKMKIKASAKHPIEWWTNKTHNMVHALQRFLDAVLDRNVTFTPAEDRAGREAELALALSRHVLNARRKEGRAGTEIRKETTHSPKVIDACMAAVLAFEARGEAIAAGVKPEPKKVNVPVRVR